MWTKYGIIVLVLAACSSPTSPAATNVACIQTLDAYCATASPKCARQVDPTNVVSSFCAGTSPGAKFGFSKCPSGRVLVEVTVGAGKQLWDYDATTHQLVSIVETAANSCLAGATSTAKTENCVGDLVAYQCGISDAGASDAKAD